jgi:mxaK protein
MINRLHIAHWALVTVAAASTLGALHSAWTLSQTNKINNFISSPADSESIPEHEKALFAKAFSDAKLGKNKEALERLTTTLVTEDIELEAAAFFNRANIHMREVLSLPPENTGRLALVGLAKQDYRNALLINSSLWDARYNLEYALNMVPEEPGSLTRSSHEGGHATVIVKAVGFRVDLP